MKCPVFKVQVRTSSNAQNFCTTDFMVMIQFLFVPFVYCPPAPLYIIQIAVHVKFYVQGDSREKGGILVGDGISHCEKKVHTNMYLILNGY